MLETVDNLNGEIRHLSAKISITPSEDVINQDIHITKDKESEPQIPTVVHDLANADFEQQNMYILYT